tara:strand:+ start:483 stop:692 length:210 start_codon:yes stop_codon:yes gene_type:complete
MTRHEQRLELALQMRNRAASMTRTALMLENRGVLVRHEAQALVNAAKALYAQSNDLERDAVAVHQEMAA